MTDEDRKFMCEVIEGTVRQTVNGKIDKLTMKLDEQSTAIKEHNEKHQQDMDEIKPFLQLLSGGKVLGNALTWVSGVAVAYLMIKGIFQK